MPPASTAGPARQAAATARKSTRKAADTAARSTGKVSETAKASARRATGTAKESAAKAAETLSDAATSAKESTAKAVGKATGSTKRAVAGARASRAAKAGMVEEARQIVDEADAQGAAADTIAQVEAMHYQVEVNKRRLSVNGLTKVLNDRWDNGWRLAHILEQRGNTVLVFEKRTP